MTEPKLFYLQRDQDVTGCSGTGRVAEGVQFADGKCVLKWNSDISSIVVHESIENVKKIHCFDGKTKIIEKTKRNEDWNTFYYEINLLFDRVAEENAELKREIKTLRGDNRSNRD